MAARASAVAGRHGARRGPARRAPRAVLPQWPFGPPPGAPPDLSGAVVARAAEAILRAGLVECGSVDVECDASALGLLAGSVDSVQLSGTRWRSPKGLTARRLAVRVGAGQLDTSALLSRGAIELAEPKPRGSATIAFDVADFGNLLRHPLMLAASAGVADLTGDGVTLTRTAGQGDAIEFQARPIGSSGAYAPYALRAASDADGGVRVTALAGADGALAQGLQSMFASLTLDLQGSRFTFKQLAVDATGEVTLELRVLVETFPLPVPQF